MKTIFQANKFDENFSEIGISASKSIIREDYIEIDKFTNSYVLQISLKWVFVRLGINVVDKKRTNEYECEITELRAKYNS